MFERRLRRRFTDYGSKPRKEYVKDVRLTFDEMHQEYRFCVSNEPRERKYRGNTLTYVRRAAEIMESEAITKQFCRHKEVFAVYLKKQLAKDSHS